MDGTLTLAIGTAEHEATLTLLDRRLTKRRVTLGADKAYDVAGFIEALRDREVTPHVAVDGSISKTGHRRKMAIDGRTTRHPGDATSQRHRKRIKEIFGRIKGAAGPPKVKLRGRRKVDAVSPWLWPPPT